MKLIKLQLRNFKGLRKLDLEPNGSNLIVRGDNATGKTTIADAFMWLLFNKDSQDRADFQIKTLNESGEPVHKLHHEVEAVIEVNGKTLTLKKSYYEKHEKKRGTAKEVFTGHTTGYEINEVPVLKKEFDACVAEIADEKIFRLLTDPTYFNEKLHWEERRQLLFDVCGDVTDEEVIASDKSLARLSGMLGDLKLEQFKEVVKGKQRKINEELKELPARIDEVQHNIPELPSASREDLANEIEGLRGERNEQEKARARLEAGGEVAEKRKRLSEIQGELKDVENRARGAIDARIQEARQKASGLQDKHDAKAREVRRFEAELEDAQAQVEKLSARRTDLREQWVQVNDRQFERSHEPDHCAVCGQKLPADQVEAAHQRAEEEFNARKAADLERISKDGHEAKDRQERLEHQSADLKDALATANEELAGLKDAVEKAQAELERLQKAVPDVSKNPAHQKLLEEQAEAQAAIDRMQADSREAADSIASEIRRLDAEINSKQEDVSRFEQRERAEARIAEHEAREKMLSTEYEQLAEQLHLTEKFTRAKVDMINERINSRFELARFKLFEEQVNGGLKDVCETTFGGVPFASLNHGARLNVGLDIIRTLGDHYGFHPPVFVDNAESVTDILQVPGQMIKLIVSAKDRKLRVETTEREEVAA
jgi:DNA repair exonuclease SbcCD ATPase subunit